MRFDVNKHSLQLWVNTAQMANTTYFRVRRTLYNKLVKLIANEEDHDFTIDGETFNTLKGFLTARNESLNDNRTLAFVKALDELNEDLQVDEQEIQPLSGDYKENEGNGGAPQPPPGNPPPAEEHKNDGDGH